MKQFKNVSVEVEGNSYFNGAVTSRTVNFADGSGKTIIKYHHKNKIKIIKSKNIQKISLQKLKNSLKKKKGIMPEYNLTNSDIVALYKFLNTP